MGAAVVVVGYRIAILAALGGGLATSAAAATVSLPPRQPSAKAAKCER